MRHLIIEVSPLYDVRLVAAIDPNAVAVDKHRSVAPQGFVEETLAILGEYGLDNQAVGVIGIDSMPYPIHRALVQGLCDKFVIPTDIVAELRSTKTPAEVEMRRKAAQLSDMGFETLVKTAKPGYAASTSSPKWSIQSVEKEQTLPNTGSPQGQRRTGPMLNWR